MIFVVQFLQGLARFNVASVEHNQVSYLVCGGFLSHGVGVSAHSLPSFFQTFPGFIMYGAHPVAIYCTGWVEWFCRRRAHGYQVKAIISIERGHTVSRCGRVIVDELGHW